jgi:hypothetical protein
MSTPESEVEKAVITAVSNLIEDTVVKVEEVAAKIEETVDPKIVVKVELKKSFFARLSQFFPQFSCTTAKALDKTVAPVVLEKPVVAEEKVVGKPGAEEKETENKAVFEFSAEKKAEADVKSTCIIA